MFEAKEFHGVVAITSMLPACFRLYLFEFRKTIQGKEFIFVLNFFFFHSFDTQIKHKYIFVWYELQIQEFIKETLHENIESIGNNW